MLSKCVSWSFCSILEREGENAFFLSSRPYKLVSPTPTASKTSPVLHLLESSRCIRHSRRSRVDLGQTLDPHYQLCDLRRVA